MISIEETAAIEGSKLYSRYDMMAMGIVFDERNDPVVYESNMKIVDAIEALIERIQGNIRESENSCEGRRNQRK